MTNLKTAEELKELFLRRTEQHQRALEESMVAPYMKLDRIKLELDTAMGQLFKEAPRYFKRISGAKESE